jgi:hypothetical protein
MDTTLENQSNTVCCQCLVIRHTRLDSDCQFHRFWHVIFRFFTRHCCRVSNGKIGEMGF